MKTTSFLITVLPLLMFCSCKTNTTPKEETDGRSLERAETPAYLNSAVDSLWNQAAADSLELHSLMIVNDGKVIYEDWRNGADAATKHVLNSVSKTFTSIAVGMTIADGKLALDEKIIDIFPEYLLENVSTNLCLLYTSPSPRD